LNKVRYTVADEKVFFGIFLKTAIEQDPFFAAPVEYQASACSTICWSFF
jgi:hypothetical protein